jgi:hypothetical protein
LGNVILSNIDVSKAVADVEKKKWTVKSFET